MVSLSAPENAWDCGGLQMRAMVETGSVRANVLRRSVLSWVGETFRVVR